MATTKKKPKKTSSNAVVVVENVNHPGKTRNVDAKKYQTAKTALLKVLPKKVGLTQSEMVAAVRSKLTGELKKKAGWWTKLVQLDLEAKDVIVRDGAKPLRWRKL